MTPASPRRAYAVVLALTVAFILYGSLFPFTWYARAGTPVAYLLGTWQDWDHRGDLLANLVLYLPFGFFLVCALPPRLGLLRAAAAVAAGAALSCGVELTQFHDLGRTTSMGDVYANLLGSAAGAAGAVLFGASIRWPLVKQAAAHPVPVLLVGLWAAGELFPYVPTIDLHKYWHAVRPLLDRPMLPAGDVAAAVVVWAFLGFVVLSLYGFRRFLLLFPLLVTGESAAKVLILDNALTQAGLLAAGLAYGGWILLHRLPGRILLLTLAMAALLVVQRLSPFAFAATATPFGWVPFDGLMHDAMGPGVALFCRQAFVIGALIWLLGRCGLPTLLAAGLTALLLFAIAWAQCWMPQRSGDITGVVMALMLGAVFSLLRSAAAPRRAAMAAALSALAPPGRRYAP